MLQQTSSARQCAFTTLADAAYVDSRVQIPLHGLADLEIQEHIPQKATHWSSIIQKKSTFMLLEFRIQAIIKGFFTVANSEGEIYFHLYHRDMKECSI